MNYVRFVVGTNREVPSSQTGVVTELRLLKESGSLPRYEQDHVNEIFRKLNDDLPCPPFGSTEWSQNAISWFKDCAQEWVHEFRTIIAILEEHCCPVRMITTTDPGTLLYEDDFQVVAVSEGF